MQLKKSGWILIVVFVIVVAGGLWWIQNNQSDKHQEQLIRQKIFISDLSGKPSAPDITLTDQRGSKISLSDFKGKTVVLQFMDPVCEDVCPVVSQEIVKANKQLGTKAGDVEYLAINVNQYHESQQDVMAFSQEQGLNDLPNWHFLTGNTEQLKAVWDSYHIDVIPNPDGDVQHGSDMYFIDKLGNERYVAYPDGSQAGILDWAKGIAYFSAKLL